LSRFAFVCDSSLVGKHARAARITLFALATLALGSCGRAYDGEGLLDAEPPKIELSTTFTDFGPTPCGGTSAATRSMAIKNGGASVLHWTAKVPDGAPFSIAPSEGDVPPREAMAVEVVSNAVASEELPGTKSAVIAFSSNDPNAPVVEMVAQRVATGGMLEIDPQPLGFGDSPVGVTIEAPLTIRNSGNDSLDVGIGAPDQAAFAIDASGRAVPFATKLLPGTQVEGLRARFTPTAKGPLSSSAAVAVTGTTCGPRPSAITLAGVGSDSTVAVTPPALDFGAVACGQTAAPKSLTVLSAPGGPPFKFSTLLEKPNSPFVVTPTTGDVGSGGSVQVKVTPKPIPTTGGTAANLYGDKLTVSTDAAGDTPHPIVLKMSPAGAMFTLSTTYIDFGQVNVSGNGRERTIAVTNTGNATGTLSFSLSSANFNIVGATSVTLAPNAAGSIIVRAKPNNTNVKDATIYVSSPSPVCAPYPTTVGLRCRGV
jgi:hypothetical protein